MKPCPCGGETAVDSFDWPGRDRIWFLRCDVCSGMSDAADTPEAAALLSINPDQAAEPNAALLEIRERQKMNEPLIYTSKGNLPVSSLEHFVGWEEGADFVKFREVYKLDGEVVREDAHVMHRGQQMGAQQAQVG